MIGLVNSILLIKFEQTGSSHSVLPVTAPAAVGFAIILLPLMDTLRVFTTRIFQGRSPFSPDRNHIHHLLLDRGFNHRSVVYACAITTCVSITSAFFLQVLGTTSTVVVLVASFFILVYLLSLKSSTRLWIIKGEVKKWPATEETGRKRLVSFYAKKAEAVGDE
ncbi:MAG: undecaprenyl-phosphate N-acetylglucosaminyl 1-phosphate transferase, partial [Segetibacter sp.]|nr:undecaprenyl-phosphate N-acetylglucosaminyl 1-phosphate transferase [Segetibacter sp.]